MNLGNAKLRCLQITKLLLEHKDSLTEGPRAGIGALLDECSELLREHKTLLSNIQATEIITEIHNTTLSELIQVHSLLLQKIELLETLALRKDLDEGTKTSLYEQLKAHRINRDNLDTSITTCLWVTELLDE